MTSDEQHDQEFTAWAVGAERQLLRSAVLLTGDLHRAQDLVQEAMVKVALRWPRLRGGQPTAYARTIVVRDNISWWRRLRREVTVDPTPALDRTSIAAVATDAEAALVVRRALNRLTPAQRAVVVLRYFDDLTERETAHVLGIAVGTVKSQVSVALARLRSGAPELLDLIGEGRRAWTACTRSWTAPPTRSLPSAWRPQL
jgi:RNA polymerase sigma-70 factor (sigma-E family)